MNKLLLLSIFAGTAAFGGPCTTAVGNRHVFATCTLGDRTFSAFATMSTGAPHLAGGLEQAASRTDVLVPFAEWRQPSDGIRVVGGTDERVRFAAPQHSDRGLGAASGNPSLFEKSASELPADISTAIGLTGEGVEVPQESNIVPLETTRSETPTLVLYPDLGTDQHDQSPGNPIVSPDIIESRGDDMIETPEPATYASIGLGLISLWCLSRRMARKPGTE